LTPFNTGEAIKPQGLFFVVSMLEFNPEF